MKRILVIATLLVLATVFALTCNAQTVSPTKGHVWYKHYGTTYYKTDSNFVSTQGFTGVIWVACDTTAGSVVAYFCQNNDSTRAQPINPPASGAYGEAFGMEVTELKFFRIKGAMPITVRILPQKPK